MLRAFLLCAKSQKRLKNTHSCLHIRSSAFETSPVLTPASFSRVTILPDSEQTSTLTASSLTARYDVIKRSVTFCRFESIQKSPP